MSFLMTIVTDQVFDWTVGGLMRSTASLTVLRLEYSLQGVWVSYAGTSGLRRRFLWLSTVGRFAADLMDLE